ncbi:hypothetical protein [Frigidibacter sp. SD6-1]|uniref:hypothetical protein n=1 Tax=Frigidibacter sp. SD6-1 TaxID=3032581 RepID=UPI0024DFD978|nr:hypothetical protein [Frigidibacter sp. SD6-1]
MTGLDLGQLAFAPLLPLPVLLALAAVAVLAVALSGWRGLRGTVLRGLAALAFLAALAGPALKFETREKLDDIVLVVTDRSASQGLKDRMAEADAALAKVTAELDAMPGVDVRRIEVPDAEVEGGTLLKTALARALAEEPQSRVAGAILITDGQIHDPDLALTVPAPLNVLLTGRKRDWDRRLKITEAPAFGIIGEESVIGLRVEEQGAMPAAEAGRLVQIAISVDGGPAASYDIPVNADLELPLKLDHAGQNIVQLTVATSPGELTERNNAAVVQVNGVRDRLRVLLISGEPYAGERTWRNLLKSDSAVDLVHFTILRPPEKEDGVPVEELALIAFPTRELFVDKIDEFDLIIFDRYPLRGILPAQYLDNIRSYVLNGGAVLVAAGADYASVESIYYSALGDIMPAAPTTRVLEGPYLPKLSDLGKRHPVTDGLEEAWAKDRPPGGEGPWGRWLRYVDVRHARGQTLMEGPEGKPLLVVDRAGEGRVALLASDQAWLWTRGFEGGGPQQELLRRLAHWAMKEPDLEEEALTATVKGSEVTIERRTMEPGGQHVAKVTGPDGKTVYLPLAEVKPGLYAKVWAPPGPGLYRIVEGDLERVFALGSASPREFEAAVASGDLLAPLAEATGGGVTRIEDGLPDVRAVRAGRPAIGRGWIGITPREAYRTVDLKLQPFMPDWAWLLVGAGLMLLAWLSEGQRRRAG